MSSSLYGWSLKSFLAASFVTFLSLKSCFSSLVSPVLTSTRKEGSVRKIRFMMVKSLRTGELLFARLLNVDDDLKKAADRDELYFEHDTKGLAEAREKWPDDELASPVGIF